MIIVDAPIKTGGDAFPYSSKVKVVEKTKGEYEIILPVSPITIYYSGDSKEESPKVCTVLQSKNGCQFQSSIQGPNGQIMTRIFLGSRGNNEVRTEGIIYDISSEGAQKVGVFTLTPTNSK